MKTLVTVVGTRPQLIKVALVSRALKDQGAVREILVHTGQHFDPCMSDVFFSELGIARPDYHLDVHGGGHGAMTGAMLQKLESVLMEVRPDCTLVYGDTNSTLAAALAAAKLHIPIAHVEAGLRSFNRAMPEEINRIVADSVADLYFTPTATGTRNLLREGVAADKIHQVGDVMYDVALAFSGVGHSSIMHDLGLKADGYVLATIHRAENTDHPLRLAAIVSALETVARKLPVILPLHPRTASALTANELGFDAVRAVPPLGYLDMVALESRAALIATDSGGVQKEAFFYRVPCVTLREETEWIELVELGWNTLAPPDSDDLAEMILRRVGTRGSEAAPYGEGNAARKIAEVLADRL